MKYLKCLTLTSLITIWASFNVLADLRGDTSGSLPAPQSPADKSGADSQLELTCSTLLNNFPAPDGNVIPFCNEAQISCVRLGLIRKALRLAEQQGSKTPSNEIRRLKHDMKIAIYEVQLKLRGCQLALDVVRGGIMGRETTDITQAAGFNGHGPLTSPLLQK